MSDETKSKLDEIMESCPDAVEFCPFDNRKQGGRAGFVLSWSKKGTGFGEITVVLAPGAKAPFGELIPQGKAQIDTECMSKEFVKEMLCKLVDDAEVIG